MGEHVAARRPDDGVLKRPCVGVDDLDRVYGHRYPARGGFATRQSEAAVARSPGGSASDDARAGSICATGSGADDYAPLGVPDGYIVYGRPEILDRPALP